jgi:hypothetical protein
MEWTLDLADRDAAKIAFRHIVHELDILPILLVTDLERDPSLVVESGFVFLMCNRAINFPVSLIRGIKTISLPVLIYNALLGSPVYLFFLWSRLMCLRNMDPADLNITQRALFIVGEWYAAISQNPPIVDLAITVGRADLRIIMCRFAYLVRSYTQSFAKTCDVITAMMKPWDILSFSPFWKDFNAVLLNAEVPIKYVYYDREKKRPLHKFENYLRPVEFVIDNAVGCVCAPSDKVVIAAVLLISVQHSYVAHATASPTFLEDQGVPIQLRPLIKLLVRATTTPIDPPIYHAVHQPQL